MKYPHFPLKMIWFIVQINNAPNVSVRKMHIINAIEVKVLGILKVLRKFHWTLLEIF